MKNRDHFSAFITEDFQAYIDRKRQLHAHGNHVELQAVTEIYNRPVHVFEYSAGASINVDPRNSRNSSGRADEHLSTDGEHRPTADSIELSARHALQ